MSNRVKTSIESKLFAFLMFLFLTGMESGAQTDSLYMYLDSTTLSIRRHSSAIKNNDSGATTINTGMIQSLPKIFGNTDPVNFIRQRPGVQTNSEFDSGIHIQGCDNSHNLISIGNIPVYGSNHLLGLFSAFIPSHHEKMTFSTSAGFANRLGGKLDMELTDTLKKPVSGEFSAGLISSQGTLRMRIGKKHHLKISTRGSYMNLLYKRWMQIAGSPIKYGFGDGNLTWLYADGKDRIWADFYFGADKTHMAEKTFDVDLGLIWGNAMGALHWERAGTDVRQKHSIYYTGFLSDCDVSQSSSSLNMTSFISTAGYKGQVNWLNISAGADLSYHMIQPQSPQLHGIIGADNNIQEQQACGEAYTYIRHKRIFADRWTATAGLKASGYLSPEGRLYGDISPEASIMYDIFKYGKIKAEYNLGRQYLFQTGISNIGFPLEFWFAAGKYSKPQRSHNISLSYNANFLHDVLAVSASVYYKKLYNQVQYVGSLFDFFSSRYDLHDHLLNGRGWNYGINLMVHKQSGSLTGWISYSLGRSLRKFDNQGYGGIYPANHERIHELNATASYKLRKWDLGSTFVYASGQPFTAPEYFYMSSGQILTVYGKHNGCRMRPYIRLDLSVTYSFIKNEMQENGINLSVYNALARHNDVMYRISKEDNVYSYKAFSFFIQLMPSISYYHKF